MCQPNFLVMTMMAHLLRLSLVSMSTTMEITFNHSFFVRLLLLGSQGVPPCRRHPQIPLIAGTGTPNLDPFFASSFNCNFRPNNNQTFIVYVKSTLVLYRKGICGYFLEEKLRGAKCCKFYGPEE